ncbi:MAG: hypothetical protein HZA90_20150 [Verrucomicrobia bacterium]|nr:hypothetical protein [Verrucomicrobiota bacterium]
MTPPRLTPLLLALLLAGCSTPTPLPDVATHIDAFTGLRTDVIPENLLEAGGQAREFLYLNASRVFKSAGTCDYYLEVIYAAREEVGYLDIGPGPALSILADGKEMKFTGNGSQHLRKKRNGVVTENALYPVQPDALRAIANAQKVTVRAAGKSGLVQRDFAPVNSERFRKFVKLCVPSK